MWGDKDLRDNVGRVIMTKRDGKPRTGGCRKMKKVSMSTRAKQLLNK